MPKYLELRPRRGKGGEYKGGAVYRKTVEPVDHRGRKLIVGMEPGDVISFREERCRKTYTIDIRWAYLQAVKQSVRKEREEKDSKRKGNRRVLRRRPTRGTR